MIEIAGIRVNKNYRDWLNECNKTHQSKPIRKRPLPLKRLMEKINFKENCWIWNGNLNHSGYGVYHFNYKKFLAHRVVYEIFSEPISNDMVLDHLCRVRNCVNPEHLRQVSNSENTKSGYGTSTYNRQKTHCLSGHPLNGDNLSLVRQGESLVRRCLSCARNRLRKHRERVVKNA